MEVKQMARINLDQASNFEKEKHEVIAAKIEDNASLVDEVVSSIVSQYSAELDSVIQQAHDALQQSNSLTDDEIDRFILMIPIQLYYSSPSQESVGVREDVAKMIRQRLYIEARQSAEGTVEDKNTAAEKAVMQETLTAAAYGRANKALKAKNEMALEVLSAFKKVISRRMEEYQINRFGGNDNGM